MSERLFLAPAGEGAAELSIAFTGTRPPALANENIHGQCVDVGYDHAVGPAVVACP